MLKKYIFTILFISWLVLITLLSLFSFEEDSIPSIAIPHMDKLVHFIFYFVFTVLGCMFLREINHENTLLKKSVFKIVIFAIIYGIVIEVLQGVATVDRDSDLLDVLANALGALIGGLAVKYIFSKKTSFKWMK